jgi:hypothetical protein
MANEKDLQALARKLDEWAQKELEKRERDLLKCLLSRGAYLETKINKRLIVGTTSHLGAHDIRQAVIDALAPLTKINLPESIEGWPRFSAWPRMGTWPRSGYWALSMGLPPKDLMHSEKPGKMPSGDPIDPEGSGSLPKKGPKTHLSE